MAWPLWSGNGKRYGIVAVIIAIKSVFSSDYRQPARHLSRQASGLPQDEGRADETHGPPYPEEQQSCVSKDAGKLPTWHPPGIFRDGPTALLRMRGYPGDADRPVTW
tara:strand:+ start:650 stop:970 length:321 start_codon:yes stop_codon:yes gene_type:complete